MSKSALALLALCATATALPAAYIEANEATLWAAFKADFRRAYAPEEEPHRRATFKANMLQAAALEAASATGATFGATRFADLTSEEFRAYRGLRLPQDALAAAAAAPRMYSESDILRMRASGAAKDWRGTAVTGVKDQGQCGSCYSFSTTGAIEGRQAVQQGKLVSLSEQQIVECSQETAGCDGGWQELAMDFLVTQRGGRVVTEAAMPYTSGGGQVSATCGLRDDMEVGATIAGSQVLPQDEDQIAAFLIENGPVAITVDASAFQTYQGGVMDVCASEELDHAVLAVGVTEDAWIVKNSWGTWWGESGFIRLRRGTNECLMANHVVAATMA